MKPHFVLIFPPILLAGCSTFSKSECRDMDWFREGRKAALEGHTPKQAKTFFIDKCHEEHGVPMDNVDFERGYNNGLNQVCTAEGLEAFAAKGIQFRETCETFDDSKNLQKTEVSELKDRIRELEAEVQRLKAENEKLSAE